MANYSIVISKQTQENIQCYQACVSEGEDTGEYLKAELNKLNGNVPSSFLSCLVNTKRPQIFAESAVYGNGKDWLQTELSLLGDINIAVDVTVFDDGTHQSPQAHDVPFSATLLFTPGALLENGHAVTPVDIVAVTKTNDLTTIDFNGYYKLYKNRLLPLLQHANEHAKQLGKTAFITLPGLGCGMFAGLFKGLLAKQLKRVLIKLLEDYGKQLSAIKAIYFDPFAECENERHHINGIDLLIRPLLQGNSNKPQLCRPAHYQELSDDFSNCHLYSVVAWDHVSWPGNDFYINSRCTDDGVKAAATDMMKAMTGIEGHYDRNSNKYLPPGKYQHWQDAVFDLGLSIAVGNTLVY